MMSANVPDLIDTKIEGENVYVLTTDYLESATARCIPGAFFSRERKAWVFVDPPPRAAAVALRVYPLLANEYPELAELRDSLAEDMRPFSVAEQLQLALDAPGVTRQLEAEAKAFYQFQSTDLGYCTAVLEKHGSTYVGWERGLGKTLGACALIESTGSQSALVVCPNTAKLSTWKPELERWLPDYEIVVLRNSPDHRAKDLAHVKQLVGFGYKVVFVVHYEALDIIRGDRRDGWKKLHQWDIVIADEVHRIANPDTKMARALKTIPTRYKVALSGSIIANHAEELFSPLQWLFPDRYRAKWRDWNDRYLDYVDGRWGRICVGIKPDQLQALQQELGVFMVYRRKEDELDLPARTDQTLYVELSPAQAKVYNGLIEDAMAELPDGSLLKAGSDVVLLGRLRQVATGLGLVTEGEPLEYADSSKLDLAMDLITDNEDEAFVVFSWYKAGAYEMGRRLTAAGIGNFVVTGDVPQPLRAQYIDRFQAGEGRVFIGTIKTIGESVTLHRANNAILLDRSWNPQDNSQAEDRIYRIGQELPVTVTHIVARDTVDEMRVQPVLADKASLRRMILGR